MLDFKKPLALLLPVLILTGCAVGPTYDAPETPVDDSFTVTDNVSRESASIQWWQQFSDPLLNDLIEQAKEGNYSLKIAAERVKLADSYRQAVSATKLPQIGLGFGYTETSLSKQGPIGGPLLEPSIGGIPLGTSLIDRELPAWYAGASIAWEPDVFNRTGYLEDAALARTEQVEILAYATEMMVTASVANNYLQLRGAQQQLSILDRQIDDLEQLKDKVAGLVRSGLAASAQESRVDSALAASRAIRPQVETAINVHMHRIAILLGKPPLSLVQQLSEARGFPELEGIIPVGLPSDLLTRRPDIRIAERQMKVANAELGAAIANQYPRFYLTGAPGSVATDFDELFSSGSGFWNVNAGVQWNLFDGGLRAALEAVAEHQTQTSALAYQRTVLQAFGEVESLLSAYGNSQKSIKQMEAAVDSARTAISKVENLKANGLASTPDVLQARMELHQLESTLTTARTGHASLVVTLYKALGGHWETV
ncbi:efflux transporter outer membrane subunit [Endozoicomonas sp.]|uniref:efflux transporter outer membrane subunit n=1 Tax=Endozoicomonas sp. TaxID=1892382 RepID=UPI0028846696|nr:efflux transporter outer membrane subunit [Endozoicomonas sp.]